MQQEVSLADEVAYLERPDSFHDGPAAIETVETHFAWVFLRAERAYKLKKPIRFGRIDFTHSEARHAYCELEVSLNRRLAEAAYLRVVPLTVSPRGLALDGDGKPIDWLVEMRRLPRDRTLEAAARRGALADAELAAVVRKLVDFYRRTPRAPWDGAAYCRALERSAAHYAAQLAAVDPGFDARAIAGIAELQAEFLARNAELLALRIRDGRVVDAHGDLRPEHIFLTDPPQIIDCLEFSIELRWLDTAEELSFLALECVRLGHAALGERILELYRQLGDDPAPPPLLDFYRSQRALVRALLSAWRVPDAGAAADKWRERTGWYLDVAEASAATACGRRGPGPSAVRAPAGGA